MKMPLLVVSLLAITTPAAAKGMTIDDMLAMQRVGAPVVSPDGKSVAFAVRDTDYEANRGRSDVWVATLDGAGIRRLTTHVENDTDPQWSPDGKSLFFLSSRSGSSQVWRISLGGGEPEQITKLGTDINGYDLFPDGRRMVLAIDVWPGAKTLADSIKHDDDKAKSKVKARVYEQLLFRHWDQWEDGKYSHLFVWSPPDLGGKADDARDLMPAQTTDSPTHPSGGMEEVDISPDGKTIAFITRNSGKANAYLTNTDVFLVPVDGRSKPVNVTADNKAYDFEPVFAPDGKSLALRQMKRPVFEADRERLSVIDLGTRKTRVLTEAWDRSAGGIAWSADGKTIYTDTANLGNQSLFAIDVATGKEKLLVDKGTNSLARAAGDRLVFVRDTLKMPAELFTIKPDGSDLRQLTHFNDERLKKIQFGDYEQFTFKGAKNETVHGFVMKPAGFTGAGGGKAPVAMLIHGGPQGSFGDHFHYRWNPQTYAGHGYATIFIDFHGSTGYGQAFTDSISGDWGGAPYEDLMLGLDHALAKFTWLDKNRVVALGASYGGFMINWINGHTDRFKALVCHDGNIDERMAYFDTEELWFPEWDHGGVPWEKPENYTKHNPIDHVKNWKTPTLVIHGGLDFRVVDTQGMATFTALQRKGVPSKFIHFPDENHWVLKPQNSKLWHDEVLAWLDRWAKK